MKLRNYHAMISHIATGSRFLARVRYFGSSNLATPAKKVFVFRNSENVNCRFRARMRGSLANGSSCHNSQQNTHPLEHSCVPRIVCFNSSRHSAIEIRTMELLLLKLVLVFICLVRRAAARPWEIEESFFARWNSQRALRKTQATNDLSPPGDEKMAASHIQGEPSEIGGTDLINVWEMTLPGLGENFTPLLPEEVTESDAFSTVTSDQPSFVQSIPPSESPSSLTSNIPNVPLSDIPSVSPSDVPSLLPSDMPSTTTSDHPSSGVDSNLPHEFEANSVPVPPMLPSDVPSTLPSDIPSFAPSDVPSTLPSDIPSSQPSDVPSFLPSDAPSVFLPSSGADRSLPLESEANAVPVPTMVPSDIPSILPSDIPSSLSSDVPSLLPSDIPSVLPSDTPSTLPSDMPSLSPSDIPSDAPTESSGFLAQWDELGLVTRAPSDYPSFMPSDVPSLLPSDIPSMMPSDVPSLLPSDLPSIALPEWGENGVSEDDISFLCPNQDDDGGAPSRDVLYAYRLEMAEAGSSLNDAVADIEGLLGTYLSTGAGTICRADDDYLGHVVGLARSPGDVPASSCNVLTESEGEGPCSFVAGRLRVAVEMDSVGDPATEAGIYCRTLDLIREFLDSGAIEKELTEVARVSSAILGQLVPDFCSVDSAGGTIGEDGTKIDGQGGETTGDETDGGDRGIKIIDADTGTVAASEGDSGSSLTAEKVAFVVPLTVVLSITLALLVSFFVYKKTRNIDSQPELDASKQENVMDQRYASQEEDDVEKSMASSQGSNDEAWPLTPDSMVMHSMSDMDGTSELASPSSATSRVLPAPPSRFQNFNRNQYD